MYVLLRMIAEKWELIQLLQGHGFLIQKSAVKESEACKEFTIYRDRDPEIKNDGKNSII